MENQEKMDITCLRR